MSSHESFQALWLIHLFSKQYHTSRGNIPVSLADQSVASAPAPGVRTRSRYPRDYRNNEGESDSPQRNFHSWETRQAENLTEYVVKQPGQRPFNYDRRAASAQQVQRPVHPNDRRRVVQNPPNDPGPFRAVTTHDQKHVVGAMFHPVNNPIGYQRAMIEPLDRQGRQHMEQQRYRDALRHDTHPPLSRN